MTSKICLTGVEKIYRQGDSTLEVLKNLSLHLENEEFVSVVGPSGCGKSTLFRLITGLEEPTAGEILIDGKKRPQGQITRMGYMPQKDLLLPWRTLEENAVIPMEINGTPKEEARRRVEELLPIFGLSGFGKAYPWELSGGMRQRAALLRTILIDSDILLLDEPFGALDAINRDKLQHWLMDVWERFRWSVLFITHSIDEAVYLSDRVYVLSDRPATVITEVAIDLPRPRDPMLVTMPEFAHYKEILLKSL